LAREHSFVCETPLMRSVQRAALEIPRAHAVGDFSPSILRGFLEQAARFQLRAGFGRPFNSTEPAIAYPALRLTV